MNRTRASRESRGSFASSAIKPTQSPRSNDLNVERDRMSDESSNEPGKPRYRPVVEDYSVLRPAAPPPSPPPASKLPVTCPGCSANLKVPTSLAGKSLRCPKCRVEVQVPWGLLAAANVPAG